MLQGKVLDASVRQVFIIVSSYGAMVHDGSRAYSNAAAAVQRKPVAALVQ